MTIADNGQGLPKNYDKNEKVSFGIQLIHLLADQIDATLTVDRKKGSAFTLHFNTTVNKTVTTDQ